MKTIKNILKELSYIPDLKQRISDYIYYNYNGTLLTVDDYLLNFYLNNAFYDLTCYEQTKVFEIIDYLLEHPDIDLNDSNVIVYASDSEN